MVVLAASFAAVNPQSSTDRASAAPAGPVRAEATGPTGDATFVGQMPAASATPAARTAVTAGTALADELPAGSPGPVVSAVVRDRNVMDIFGVDSGQRIYTAAWKPDHTDGWHRWAQLNGGIAAPGTSVYGVSRQTDQLDIFAVGSDHKVYSAAWNPSNGTQWAGW